MWPVCNAFKSWRNRSITRLYTFVTWHFNSNGSLVDSGGNLLRCGLSGSVLVIGADSTRRGSRVARRSRKNGRRGRRVHVRDAVRARACTYTVRTSGQRTRLRADVFTSEWCMRSREHRRERIPGRISMRSAVESGVRATWAHTASQPERSLRGWRPWDACYGHQKAFSAPYFNMSLQLERMCCLMDHMENSFLRFYIFFFIDNRRNFGYQCLKIFLIDVIMIIGMYEACSRIIWSIWRNRNVMSGI